MILNHLTVKGLSKPYKGQTLLINNTAAKTICSVVATMGSKRSFMWSNVNKKLLGSLAGASQTWFDKTFYRTALFAWISILADALRPIIITWRP